MTPILIACGSLVLYYILDVSRYNVSRDSL